MRLWKTAGLTVALLGAAGVGAAVAPVTAGQSGRARAPIETQVLAIGGGRLGVSVRDVEDSDSSGKGAAGVVVESVEEGSAAEKAGIQKGDVVVEFDSERVRSVRQFTRLVSETPPGRTVTATVQRGGQRVTVNVTPRDGGARAFEGDAWRAVEELRNFGYSAPRATRPPAPAAPPSVERFIWPGTGQLGITMADLSPQLAEYFGTKEGVLVSAVRADSAAAKAGLKAGDVITNVDGATIQTPSDLRRRLQRLEAGDEFTLGVVRDKKSLTLKGKLESTSSRRWTTQSII